MANSVTDNSRRRFLKRSTLLASGSLLVGFQIPVQAANKPAAYQDSLTSLMADAFIRIDSDNTVTLLMNHAEFGNGVYTSMAMMVAEELDHGV